MEQKNLILRVSDKLGQFERTFTWVFFFVMLCLLMIQVVCRYYLHLPLAWAEELLRYLYICVSFTGAIVAVKERSHIEINIIPVIIGKVIHTDRGKANCLRGTDIVAYLICAAFWAHIAKLMFDYMLEVRAQGQLSVAMQIPMWWIVIPIVVSAVLCALHYVINLASTVAAFSKNAEGKEGAL